MSAESFGFKVKSGSGSGVDFLFAFHYETILDEFTNEDSRVGLTDLFEFVRIDPDSFLSALENFRSDSFLTFEADHGVINNRN